MKSSSTTVVNGRNGKHGGYVVRVCCLAVVVSMFAGGMARAQSVSTEPVKTAAASPQVPANVPELSTHEEVQTFQVKVNLVEVRAVVRDAQGNAVGNLKQEDFLLFDDNKPQTITRFSVEKRDDASKTGAAGPQTPGLAPEGEPHPVVASGHLVLFLLDDVNSTANDLVGARNAVEERVKKLGPGELMAIVTISGQGNQDFTNDQEKLRAALSQLKPRPVGGPGLGECPPFDYYIATQIDKYHDERAFLMVMQEVNACQFDGNRSLAMVRAQTYSAVSQMMQAGGARMQLTLQGINDVVRRVAALQGQRTIVFLSPGIYVGEQQAALTDYLNRAIRAGVVINTLDVRGVYTQSPNGVDISQRGSGIAVYAAQMNSYRAASDLALQDAMMQIANTTGGSFFHNRNDLAAGVEKLTAAPEYSYLLAFTPQSLKNDGKFHKLKVQLKQGAGLTVQARNGYMVPKTVDPTKEAQREIEDEVFAQNELHELPLQMQTQFYRSGDDKAHINVVIRVDVQRMAFRKSEGRNLNDLTVVTALFDRNANFITAKSQTVQMHIKDETLTKKLTSGISLKSNFEVGPGSYVIRVVARDGQGKLATQNGVVEIP